MKKWIFIVIAIIIVILIIAWIFPTKIYRMNGTSMEPTYHNNDILVVSKSTSNLARGDVIIVEKNLNQTPSVIVKRIVGLPNEKIAIIDGKFYINDQSFDLSTIVPGFTTIYTNGNIEVVLKGDEYYVLGDNLLNSLDSRHFGPVKLSEIIGKVTGKQ